MPAGIEQSHITRFTRLAIITLIATYLLILVGSSVRASGAGMGCPDWPTCFGMLIPPVSVAELPADYQTIYAEQGYANTDFNPRKTWTEFGNRMTSVVVGILMLACLLYALCYLRRNTRLITLLAGMLVVTGIQGWLGSIVVASFLNPLVVSSHMVLALIIIVLLHAIVQTAAPAQRIPRNHHLPWLYCSGIALLLQTGLGIEVREAVDQAQLLAGNHRLDLLQDDIGSGFSLHLVLSPAIAILCGYTIYRLWQDPDTRQISKPWTGWWAAALIGNLTFGTGMWILQIPAFLQPLHLLAAAIQTGMAWHLVLLMLRSTAPGARSTRLAQLQ